MYILKSGGDLFMPDAFDVAPSGLPDGPVVIEVLSPVRAGDLFVVTIRFAAFTRHTTTVQLGCSHPDAVQTQGFRAQHGGICAWPLWPHIAMGESRCLVPLRASPSSSTRPLPCGVTFYVAGETADLANPATWRAQAMIQITF